MQTGRRSTGALLGVLAVVSLAGAVACSTGDAQVTSGPGTTAATAPAEGSVAPTPTADPGDSADPGGVTSSSAVVATGLVGPTWKVHTQGGGDAMLNPAPAVPSVSFTFADDGTVEVDTGCSTGTVTYSVDGDRIRFGDVSSLEGPGCEAYVHAPILILMRDGFTYSLQGGDLKLVSIEASLLASPT